MLPLIMGDMDGVSARDVARVVDAEVVADTPDSTDKPGTPNEGEPVEK